VFESVVAVPEGRSLVVRVTRGERSSIVYVEGESDSAGARRLGVELRSVCNRYPLVVLDCAGLRFLGSTGLEVLLDAHRRARVRGHVLRIVVSSPAVLAVLRVSGADRELAVFGTMDAALTT